MAAMFHNLILSSEEGVKVVTSFASIEGWNRKLGISGWLQCCKLRQEYEIFMVSSSSGHVINIMNYRRS